MAQYIDKDALVAEIDSLQDATMDENRNFLSSYHEGIFNGLSEIEAFIDNLEVKEIDLEKEFDKHAGMMPMCEFTHDNDVEEALEWAKKEFHYFFELGLNTRKI